MKISVFITIAFLIIGCAKSKKQDSSHKIKGTPQLTYLQMLEDHDSLVSYINQVSPIIYFNKEVRGIDFNQYADKLRLNINSETTMPEYLNVIQKTVNAAQDGHTNILWPGLSSIVKNHWIPDGIDVVGNDSTAFGFVDKYNDYLKKEFYTQLELELIYSSGEYYNLLPFSYKGRNYPSSMKLISCNNQNIHQFVKGMVTLVSPMRWDKDNRREYFERFYQSSFIYKQDSLHLMFLDNKNKEHRLSIAKKDTVTFLKDKKLNFGYNEGSDSIRTHYFKKERIFYAKLPFMEEQLGDSLSNKLKSIISNSQVEAVVLDIRGNGGGNDNTYSNFLKKIIKDTLQVDLKLGRNYSSINREFYKINKDTIVNNPSYSFEVDNVATLQNPKMYYIVMPKYNFVIPDSISYPFNGNIYILQDRFIYSSSSNLSNLAKKNEQLISVGENPNLLGGLQTVPIILCLPHSKVLLRIEPQIDFTDAKTKADIFQNNVEYLVNYSIDFLYERTITFEDVFGKDFLISKDPIFKEVIRLERLK
ncbi:S41 family peptidase [Aquimarina aquimarini]|uniref:S41 family peptidase n=1 Tax=Aquimarina aquimarini TaxID=1191734 RepID=UPI000D55C060|nr:S41 family peptidase [Aquimarina aquimarini]